MKRTSTRSSAEWVSGRIHSRPEVLSSPLSDAYLGTVTRRTFQQARLDASCERAWSREVCARSAHRARVRIHCSRSPGFHCGSVARIWLQPHGRPATYEGCHCTSGLECDPGSCSKDAECELQRASITTLRRTTTLRFPQHALRSGHRRHRPPRCAQHS